MADIFKRNAASFIAMFEYKFHLLALKGVVVGILFFFVWTEENRNFTGIVMAIVVAMFVGYFAREWVFSRLLLNKHSDEEVRALWLKYGGFSE